MKHALVACEPATLDSLDDSSMQLSAAVAAAIEPACDLVEQLVHELRSQTAGATEAPRA